MNRQPWPDRYLARGVFARGAVEHLKSVLADSQDEAPMQYALETTPTLLRSLIPPVADAWCFPRPSLGGEFIPDFLLCYRNSLGYNWLMVELESPTQAPLIKAGRPGAKLNEALGQIRDWRIWLRQNISYAQNHLGLHGLDAECPAFVVIGRRSMIAPAHVLRYRELSNGPVSVMSYDRLIETIETGSAEGGVLNG